MIRKLGTGRPASQEISKEMPNPPAEGPAFGGRATLRAYERMAQAREPEPLGPRLRELRCPVWLLIGAAPHEGGVPGAQIDLLRRELSSFRVETVTGSCHFVFEERPALSRRSTARSGTACGRTSSSRRRSSWTSRDHRPKPVFV